ncbi:sensor histidine kinase [Pseudooceanicola nanhaiensis]|uniref:sensor histidine kinase n=2 Tax=Pseudooceanicola nanhaiensis TaxID=375761 RepID=UPI0012EB30AB|nr:HAMP domain-containing sensor histidine kinase [Pseudooceanicola nanhaiensis]
MSPPRRSLASSASLRVTLIVAAGIIVLSLSAMALQYRITATALETRQAELLSAELSGFAQFYEQRRIPGLREAIAARAALTTPDEGLYLLQDRNGTTLAGNIDRWPGALAPEGALFAPAPLSEIAIDGTEYLGVARELPGGFPFLAARAWTPVTGTLDELRGTILWVAAGLSTLALLAGWLVARAVVGRIGRINALADRVAGGDLSARLPGPQSADEFGALERHVNQMLDRIEALNRATHRLSDAIAHELRTPLNRIRQRLDRLEGQDEDVAAIREDMAGTVRIFDSLLDISSAEAASGQRPGLVPVDLSAIAAEVYELYEPLAEDRGLIPEARIEPGAWVLGERNLIAQLVSNLLDNAIKFTGPGDGVTLSVTAGERHMLTVADTGPGVPDDIRATVFDRFTRGERDRAVAGHGLGLALVQAIAARHGAKLSLPAAPRGFRIEIAWPSLPRP